jgi:hypothetical protein
MKEAGTTQSGHPYIFAVRAGTTRLHVWLMQ